MAYFQPQNNNIAQLQNQQQLEQGPLYQQPQVYQQYQGGYPPQQGVQPPIYGGNPHNYVVGQPPQNGVYPQYQGYPPANYNQGIYPLQPNIQQTRNINFNQQPGVIIISDNVCLYCSRPYTLIEKKKKGGQVLLAFFLLLIFFWPLCWLPFFIDDCKDIYYYCSQCGKLIYKRQFTMRN